MSRRLLTLIIFVALAAGVFINYGWWNASAESAETAENSAAETAVEPAQQRRARQRPARRRTPVRRTPRAGLAYTDFSHSTQAHRERSCQSCHTIPTPNWIRVRKAGQAFPDVTEYPDHASCLDCHRRQFFSGARPTICSICHTNVSPRDGTTFAFANQEEDWAIKKREKPGAKSEFISRFPHERHLDVMARLDETDAGSGFGFVRVSFSARQDKKEEVGNSCSVCHQIYQPKGDSDAEYIKKPAEEPKKDNLGREEPFWFKRGTMMTSASSHASCFACHWQEGGEKPLSNDCAGCHTLLTAGLKLQLQLEGADAEPEHPSVVGVVSERMVKQWNQRRSARFTHEQSNHARESCTSCHVAVTGASRINTDTLFVPIQTCGKCHGTKTGSNKSRTVLANEVKAKQKDNNFQCTKCHINLSSAPASEIPRSHTAMVE